MTQGDGDHGIETLLNLHGWTAEVGEGFWVCVKAFRIHPDTGRPHGLNYSLTMHRPGGSRLLGYDNAHYPKIGSGPSRRSQRIARGFDHRHFRERINWYDFESSTKLIDDFWTDVATIMGEEGVPWL